MNGWDEPPIIDAHGLLGLDVVEGMSFPAPRIMSRPSDEDRLLSLIPQDGATIGNRNLCEQLGWDEEKYWRVREKVLEKGLIAKAPGRGGAVRRTSAADSSYEDIPEDPGPGIRHRRTQEEIFFDLVPEDGSRITNSTLGEWLGWDDEKYKRVRERLVDKGAVIRGPGPGGTIRRAQAISELDAPKLLSAAERQRFIRALLARIPEDGSSIGNRALLEGLGWDEDTYAAIRDRLVEEEILLKGGGPGGTLRRAEAISKPDAPKPSSAAERQRFTRALLARIPEDGSSIGNRALLEGLGWDEGTYAAIRDRLVEEEILVKGGGPGGTLRRAEAISEPDVPKLLSAAERQRFTRALLARIPEDGSSIGNRALIEGLGWDEDTYAAIRDRLVAEEILIKGGGPGGIVRRAKAASESEEPKPLRAPERQGPVKESNTPEPRTGRPKVFIGSSLEGLEIAEAIQLGLDHVAECTIWTQGVFGLSSVTLDTLIGRAKLSDWAVLVLTPDDLINKRDKTGKIPRDNVIFELGLFMGALGREHTFMVYNRDTPMELPSDLAGVTAAMYGSRSDDNLAAALGAVCTLLKKAIKA